MFKNYFKIALRNLLKNKVYVLINTLGMGIAIACCLTAYLFIAFNLEFDSYFKKADLNHVVKVMHHYQHANGDQEKEIAAPMVLATRAAQDIAAIEDFARFTNHHGTMAYEDNAFHENLRFADASFFEMFKIDLSSGSHKNFNNQHSIFLSEASAAKLFADTDPIGKSMTVEFNNKKYDVVVGGVFEKLPLNISFHMEALLRIETLIDAYDIQPDEWDWSAAILFKLTDINQRLSVSEQLNRYISVWNEEKKDTKTTSFELLPFHEPVVNGEVERSELRLPIPYIAVFIFATLAFIILLIACFNLTNTTIALTGRRMKEIAMRKVMGSGKKQIIGQFILEMVITIALAIVAGFLLAQIIVPAFANMWQLQFGLEDLNGLNLVITLIILLFVTALLAGIYPALFNSKFQPIELLKGGKHIKGTNSFTRVLLVLQFSLSVIVLIAGIVFTLNADYQRHLNFGYDMDNMINVPVQNIQQFEQYKNAIVNHSKIEAVAGAVNPIGPYTAHQVTVRLDTTAAFKTNLYNIGDEYLEVTGLDISAGRKFIKGSRMDDETAVLVDENFVSNHLIEDPLDTRITYKEQSYRIIGVVKNHLSGLKDRNDTEYIYMLAGPSDYRTLVVRANAESINTVENYLEKEWKKLFPDQPYQGLTQREVVYEEANAYNGNLKQIFLFMTILGCLLSASGIYALASLNVQKRIKEIGVRKVLGATVSSIINLMNKEFAVILGLAMILGGVGGFFLTSTLLKDLYAQHIEISLVYILLSGAVIFIIGILTTSGTIYRAAVSDPTDTLRDE